MDAGLASPSGEEIVDPERVKGAHIEALANSLSDADYKKRFSSYMKEGFDPKKFTSLFESAKEAISKE